jgi:hypothetical protein
MVLFQKYVGQFGLSTKMASTAKLSFSIGSYGKFTSKSSCLEPNFDKIVIGWSSSKIVSGGPAL